MNKISCDICVDLIPLVKDEVASEDSKHAVLEHIKSCENCRKLYGEEMIFEKSDAKIISKIKNHLIKISLVIITLGVLLGISISANQFMFYNILIMPIIGGIAYFSLKKKALYACVSVFVIVYLRWLYDSLGYALKGDFMQAFVPPFWWAFIYFGLMMFGVLISALLCFGFRKEQNYEKNS